VTKTYTSNPPPVTVDNYWIYQLLLPEKTGIRPWSSSNW
jgi:hypothetical protein